MENASKALIMAGSVLLSMIIIGALVFMFNSLRGVKQTEASSEQARKLAEYNKKIEGFNRNIYGSEVISLANLIDDYNKRQAGLKDYGEIKITINIDENLSTTLSINKKTYTNYNKLIEDFENLEKSFAKARVKPIKVGDTTETAEKIAGMKLSVLQSLMTAHGDMRDPSAVQGDPDVEKFINLKKEFT